MVIFPSYVSLPGRVGCKTDTSPIRILGNSLEISTVIVHWGSKVPNYASPEPMLAPGDGWGIGGILCRFLGPSD